MLDSPDGLCDYNGGPAAFGGGYHLDTDEWARVASSFVSPSVSGDSRTGWALDLCTVYGAMHDKSELVHHRFVPMVIY